MDGDKKIIRLVCMYHTCQYIYNTYMYCVWTWWRRKHFFLLLLPFAGDNNMTFIDRFCQKATAQLSSLSNHSRLQIIWHHLLQQWVSKRACLEDVQNIDTLSRYRWHRVCTSKNVCVYLYYLGNNRRFPGEWIYPRWINLAGLFGWWFYPEWINSEVKI